MLKTARVSESTRLLQGEHLERRLQEAAKTQVNPMLLYRCEAWKLSAQARRKLNCTVSKML